MTKNITYKVREACDVEGIEVRRSLLQKTLHIMEQEKATVKCIFLLWELCQNENKRKSQQPIISSGEKRKVFDYFQIVIMSLSYIHYLYMSCRQVD